MEFTYKKGVYTYRKKNDAGQTMVFEIEGRVNADAYGYDYFVRFYIATKRKQGYQSLTQTGKCGTSGLLFAKRCLIDFIEYCKRFKLKGRIYVSGDDMRRYNIYRRSLTPMGFVEKKCRHPYLVFDLKDRVNID